MPIPAARQARPRSLLRDDVFISIREAILRGQLEPGEQLRDAALGEWLGVSRTPVREALLRLEREGLVVARPGRMTQVAPEDPERIEYAREVAAVLHGLAVETAGPRLNTEDMSSMRAANDQLQDALTAHNAALAVAADDAFHAVALERAANPVLTDQLTSVTGVLRRTEHLHFGAMTDEASVDQHDHIVAALEAGDYLRAAALTRDNWRSLAHSET